MIEDGLIGGDIPGIDHKGCAPIGFAAHYRGDDRIRISVGIDGRDIGADGPCAVKVLDVGRHPQHIALLVHALKDRGGAPDQALDHVHDRGFDREDLVLAQPVVADH